MSAEPEVEEPPRVAGDDDEEEQWLYGEEERDDKPEEEKAAPGPDAEASQTSMTDVEAEAPVNGTNEDVSQEAEELSTPMNGEEEAEEDSNSDSDDDIQVTIRDITTGAPQYTGVNLNIKAGARPYTSAGNKQMKGISLDAPGNIGGNAVLEIDMDTFEEKPWRKPGADLSDYFNYGFQEETWKAYCEKQKCLRQGLDQNMNNSTSNRITVQQSRTCNSSSEMEPEPIIPPPPVKPDFTASQAQWRAGPPPNRITSPPYWGKESIHRCVSGSLDVISTKWNFPRRKPSGTIDVIGGQTTVISRFEGRRRDRDGPEPSPIQVLGTHAHQQEFELNHNKPTAFSLPGAPPPLRPMGIPPAFLPPPPIPPPPVSVGPPHVPPPGYLPPPMPGPPPMVLQAVDSGPPPGFLPRPPPPPFGYPPVANFPPVSLPSHPWPPISGDKTITVGPAPAIVTSGPPASPAPQIWERERMSLGREICPRSPNPPGAYGSDEDRFRYQERREYPREHERSYERDRERSSFERERNHGSRERSRPLPEDRQHRERRHREKDDGSVSANSSSGRHKSSRRRHHEEDLEGEGHRRHKHKKSKRNRDDKETEGGEERVVEPESPLPGETP
uniref:pre-mRNA 3'-end-processing factor FIP1 n=1 Tax=Myxine glutinosa TaxID=7769 RepID=UPI00358FEDF8